MTGRHRAVIGPLLILVAMTALLTGSVAPAAPAIALPPARAGGPASGAAAQAAADQAVPTGLTDPGLDLRAGPVAVPLELRIPSLAVSVAVLGVGITTTDVMDAPEGPAADPVWHQAFWYRGSAVPGAPSTALMAAHVDDSLGRPGPFADLDRLRPGDPIVVHDTASGLDVRFSVTGSTTYTLAQAAEPAVLTQIYGAGPVAGTGPQASADGLAHLTLVTCAGTFRNGTHDHRLVVSATRV
jgi:hypothetical protein